MAASDRDPSQRRGRPRSAASEQAVLHAALDLMAEGQSPASITIKTIAQRACAGRDTIYRRWDNKEDLLLDALASQLGELEIPPDAGLRDALIASLAEMIGRMQNRRTREIARSLQSAGDEYPKLRRRYEQEVVQRRHDLIRPYVQRARKRGELRDDLDVGQLIQMPFHHVLMAALGDRPVGGNPHAAAAQLVDAVFNGIAAAPIDGREPVDAETRPTGSRPARAPARRSARPPR